MHSGDDSGHSLVDQALGTLKSLLGDTWTVTGLPLSVDNLTEADSAFDARVQVQPPDNQSPFTELLVVAKQHLTPRSVMDQIAPVANVLRHARSRQTLLVAAPWISKRTQQELRDRGIGYIDLTGNVSLSVTYPSIRLHTEGARHAPRALQSSETKKNVTLAGPRAGRIVRFLTDWAPPYRANQIARAARVSPPWVSRLLNLLEDQLLVRRDSKGIVAVNWPDLLRTRALNYDLMKHNPYVGMIAPNGINAVLDTLRTLPSHVDDEEHKIAVTGPYANRAVAPLTSGGQLMLYVKASPDSPDNWGRKLGLIRVEEGADVLLLRAHDDVVFSRHRMIDGIPHVALSQLVLDGLAGPGRMPAEAEAVLNAMITTERSWRLPWQQED